MSSAKKWDVKVNIIPKKSKSAENTESTLLNSKSFNEENSKFMNNENNLSLDQGSSKDSLSNNELDIGNDDFNKIIIKSSRKIPPIPEANNNTGEEYKQDSGPMSISDLNSEIYFDKTDNEPKIKPKESNENNQSTLDKEYNSENFFKKKEENKENKLDDYIPELELFYKYDKDNNASQNKTDLKEEKSMIEKDNNPVKDNKTNSTLFDVNNLDLSAFNSFTSNDAPKTENKDISTPEAIVSAPETETPLSKKDLKKLEKEKKIEAERLAKEREIEEKRLAEEKKNQEKLDKKNKKKKDVNKDNVIVDENLKSNSLKEVKAQSKSLGYMLANGEKIYRSYKYNASKTERIDVTNKRLICVNSGFQQVEINEITGIDSKFKKETKASFVLFGLILLFIAAAGVAIVLNLIPLNQASWLTPSTWIKYTIYGGIGLSGLIGLILLFACIDKDFFICIYTKPQNCFFTIRSLGTHKNEYNDKVVTVKANKDAYLVVAELGAAILNIKEYNKRQEKKI